MGVEVSYTESMVVPLIDATKAFIVEEPTRFSVAQAMISKEHSKISFQSSHMEESDLEKLFIMAEKIGYNLQVNDLVVTLIRV